MICAFFALCFLKKDLFIYFERVRRREKERDFYLPVPSKWLQWPGLGQFKARSSFLGLPHGCQRSKYLDQVLLLFVVYHSRELDRKKLQHKLHPYWMLASALPAVPQGWLQVCALLNTQECINIPKNV